MVQLQLMRIAFTENEYPSLEMILLLVSIELLLSWQIIVNIKDRISRLCLIIFRLLATYKLIVFLLTEPWHYAAPIIYEILVLIAMKLLEELANKKHQS